MDEYGASTYGDRIAHTYDAWYTTDHPPMGPTPATVAFLKELADDGPALELGIGTGRVALPLQEAGVEVHGLDASEGMVAKLRAKPGGDRIAITMGDFREFSLETHFRLIYVAFNTFFGLLTQDDQIACLRCVAKHLTDGGAFVAELFVPDPGRFDRGQHLSAEEVGTDEVRVEITKHDPVEQTSTSAHVVIREDGIRMYPVRIRYAHVAELDLMARVASLRLRERFADWDRTPFSSEAQKHVSVYELNR